VETVEFALCVLHHHATGALGMSSPIIGGSTGGASSSSLVDLDAMFKGGVMAVEVNARQLRSQYSFVEPKQFNTSRGHGNGLLGDGCVPHALWRSHCGECGECWVWTSCCAVVGCFVSRATSALQPLVGLFSFTFVAGSPDTVLESVRMDKLAKKKALAAKKTFFTESRPTLTGIQHLFPSKSEAVLLKEAGVSTSKGPTATCECPAFVFLCVRWRAASCCVCVCLSPTAMVTMPSLSY
jgi:hypothetical protein